MIKSTQLLSSPPWILFSRDIPFYPFVSEFLKVSSIFLNNIPSFSSLDIISWLVDYFAFIDLPSPSTLSSQCSCEICCVLEDICILNHGPLFLVPSASRSRPPLLSQGYQHSRCISFPHILDIPGSVFSLILPIFVQIVHAQKLQSINFTMFFMQTNSSLFPPS